MPLKSPNECFDIPEVSLSNFFLSCIEKYGDDTALIENNVEGKSLTFKQLYKQIQSCGRFFQKQKINKGDVVSLVTPNCLEHVVAMVGVISCGAIISLYNPAYKEGEMQHIFKITKPKILIVSEKCIDTVKRSLENSQSNQVQRIIVIGKSIEFETWDEVIVSSMENEENCVSTYEISPKKDLAFLPHSSGTTGLSKCVMHTHFSMIATISSTWHHFGYKRGDTFYNERPMFHVGGFILVLTALQGGVRVIMDHEFDIERALAAIQKYEVNHFVLVPPILLQMSQTELHRKYDTTSWKTSITGGASIPPTVMKAVIDRFSLQVYPVYGMTECFPISWNNEADSFTDSVGSVCVNAEIMIIDPNTEEEVKSGEDGEICVRGPQMTSGYYKNTEATEKTIKKDGFLRTGDIGHIANDMLYVVGRLKEVIKYNAYQVPPAEIENLLLRHPGVKDVGVVGVPDPVCGELPKALVVRKVESVTAEQLEKLIKDKLADYKQLRGGIQFVTKIPKSKLGKIDRIELKKLAMK
uniref:4-coumarate--CoA ligase 1-like isoform X2 n=1 Tax=Styela clava TaxID=7725 RepID=UPI00193973BE|nr:4-coumarate--CoA ligase 1-like isoform X2 [Styela clava]